MKLLVKDDFLDDVNLLRDKALQFNFDCSEDFSFDPGWRGYRTKKLKLEDDEFINSCSDKILTEVSKFFNIEGYSISTYFHVSYLKTKETLAKFEDKKYHTDHTEYAGVLYLHPNPPKGTGTSVLDGENNKIIQVENVYNRLVCYPGISLHAPSNLFGDVIENGRMTCPFFISKYLGWSTN